MPIPDTSIQIPSHINVIASLLVDPSGKVSESGNSLPLSSPEDRSRLRALRRWASWILVGSTTLRSGGYQTLGTRIVSYSRSTNQIQDWSQELTRMRTIHGPRILIEAGPNILHQLLDEDLVERLYLTRTSRESKDSTSARFDLARIDDEGGLKLIESTQGIEDRFEVYEHTEKFKVSQLR